MNRLALILLLLIAFAPERALAWPRNTTQEELMLLPPWCAHTQASWGNRPDIYNSLVAKYGSAWTHMHHYCYGLINYSRLQRMKVPRQHRDSVYHSALQDIKYVLDRSDKTFAFRPEILITLTRLHMLAKAMKGAENSARTLVADWPEVADGYTLLADVLIRTDRRAEAVDLLKKGEEMSADKDRFQKLKSILPLK